MKNNINKNNISQKSGEVIRMKNSRNKLAVISLTAFLMLFGLVTSVHAGDALGCNLTNPTASGTVNKLTQLNASFNTTLDGTTANVSVAFEAKATNSINSSFSLLGNITNTSNLRHTNLTFGDNILMPDGESYTFRATCYLNSSGTGGPTDAQTTSSEITQVKIDRSLPAVAITDVPNTVNTTSAAITITYTLNNATSYIFKHTGDTDKRVAITTNLATQTFTQVITPRNNAQIQVVGDDGTNTTTITYTYTLSGNLLIGATQQGTQGQSVVTTYTQTLKELTQKQKATIVIIVLGAVFLLVLILIVKTNKKRR